MIERIGWSELTDLEGYPTAYTKDKSWLEKLSKIIPFSKFNEIVMYSAHLDYCIYFNGLLKATFETLDFAEKYNQEVLNKKGFISTTAPYQLNKKKFKPHSLKVIK